MGLIHQDLTDKVIKAFYAVYNELGYGFLEKVYENALFLQLTANDLNCVRQQQIKVFYNGQIVGEYYADLVVNNSVIIELKAAETLANEHELQLVNYLRATEFEVGLLLNFGKRPQFKRKLFTNDLKKIKSV